MFISLSHSGQVISTAQKGLSHELLARTILPFLALKAATADVEGSEMRRHMATIMSQTPTASVAETCRTPTIICRATN